MKVYYEIKDMLEKELEQIADKRELTTNSLEVMDKVVDIIKDIETICAMKEAGEYGYSNDYMYDDGGSSYARGRGRNAKRDSMGRYSRESGYSNENGYSNRYYGENYSNDGYSGRRGYSREDSREHMISELDRMERDATDESQKSMIRNWKNQLKNA